jgi:hypothetical protein
MTMVAESGRSIGRICIGGLLAASVMLAAEPAGAVEGCPNPDNPGDIVVIGSVAELVGEVGVRVQRALLAAFEMRFEKADNDLKENAQILYCDSRRIGDSSSYDAAMVGVLNDERVLLEVGAKSDGSDILVTYVVIPIRHYSFEEGHPSAGGYYQSLYEKSRISTGLDQLFKGNAELRLMAALALGLRYEKLADGEPDPGLRQTVFERSRAYYCDAVGALAATKPQGDALGLSAAEWQALHDFANEAAVRLFAKATGDPDYVGALQVVASERGGAGGGAAAGIADNLACLQ